MKRYILPAGFAAWCAAVLAAAPVADESRGVERVYEGFVQAPAECQPRTRWWWMGNALRKEDITWQLDQMCAQGIGGVEQISMEPVYAKGNHAYLSREYFELLRFAVEEAGKRGMQFSVNFGGPGWIWGGDWVPREDQSKVLLASAMQVEGPRTFSGALPRQAALNPRDVPRSTPVIADEDHLTKAVAARMEGERLCADTLMDLSHLLRGDAITWAVPEGRWQLMAFWLTQRDSADAVDHLDPGAMARYCAALGAKYEDAIGAHFGTTVDSFFGDSFEVPIYRNGLYWNDGLFAAFEEKTGYDLVPWLPALWWDVGGLSSKVRYDVNAFLHARGMEAFFQTFLDWCERHGVQGRIQPYGFVTDNIEGAGKAHIPEMEVTAGEKDAVPWFDTRIGPKQYVASGAHLYGRNIVSTESFTYLHWEPYRATLEELKAATDGYLLAGANQFYNHGFIASPERGIVPTRGFFAAIRISPENIWWPCYHHLAAYTARCCWLLRQGRFVADVAVYSPLANQWTQSALNARKWTREFDWGGLGQLLMANGYGFDLVNDDVFQHRASWDGCALRLGEMTYRVLVLPDVQAMPLETLRQIEAFVRQGGAVIALERVPESSTGMQDHARKDAEVQRICSELFRQAAEADDADLKDCGRGRTFFLKSVMYREDPLDWRSAPLDPFLKTLRQCVAPDMDIDLVAENRRKNEGLACIHRNGDGMEIYFLSNVQETPIDYDVGLRATRGRPFVWNPQTGERRPLLAYRHDEHYTRFALSLQPFESRCIVFEETDSAQEYPHVTENDFADILQADASGFNALASRNGPHAYSFDDGGAIRSGVEVVSGLPAAYEVNGLWNVRFPEEVITGEALRWTGLKSWTEEERLRHFSGQAHYTIGFELPDEYLAEDIILRLSLGVVGNVAEVRLNGRPVGVHWMAGQEFGLEGIVRPGGNALEVAVTNTLINRVSGLGAFPDVPEELRPVFGADPRASAPEAENLLGFEPLPRSGLLGPVRIVPFKRAEIRMNASPVSQAG